MKNNGEIPHEKGLQMIRGEMELIFNWEPQALTKQ
jgi:hypothetical protein